MLVGRDGFMMLMHHHLQSFLCFFFFLKAGGKPFLIPGKFKIKKTKCQVMHFRTLICIPATLPHHKKTKTETKTAVCLLKRGNQEVRFLALIPIQNVG